jgi:hypothetical protein
LAGRDFGWVVWGFWAYSVAFTYQIIALCLLSSLWLVIPLLVCSCEATEICRIGASSKRYGCCHLSDFMKLLTLCIPAEARMWIVPNSDTFLFPDSAAVPRIFHLKFCIVRHTTSVYRNSSSLRRNRVKTSLVQTIGNIRVLFVRLFGMHTPSSKQMSLSRDPSWTFKSIPI